MKVPWFSGKKFILYIISYRFRQRVGKIALQTLQGLRFMDAASIAFGIWLAVTILIFHKNLDNWYVFIASRILLILALLGIIKKAQKNGSTWNFLKNWYPWLLAIIIYKEMGSLVFLVFPYWFDPAIIDIEQAIFGLQPSIWLAQKFDHIFILEFMHFSYFTYYLMVPLLGGILYFRKKNLRAFQDFITAIIMSYYISYIGFVLVPAEGPRYALAAQGGVQLTDGWIFTKIITFLMGTEALHGGAMPSSHSAIALVYIVFCYKYVKKLFYISLPFTIGLFIACVYGRYHYVLDVIIGIGIGAIWCWAAPAINSWWRDKIMVYDAFPTFSKLFESENIISNRKNFKTPPEKLEMPIEKIDHKQGSEQLPALENHKH